jgi:hypothetical protein
MATTSTTRSRPERSFGFRVYMASLTGTGQDA